MRAVLLIATLLFQGNALAVDEGSHLLRSCNAALKQQEGLQVSEEEMLWAFWCVGYVAGFIDSQAVATAAAKSVGGNSLCLPHNGVDNEQAIRILVKWLKSYPERLHESGRMNLYIALLNAFPCKKQHQ